MLYWEDIPLFQAVVSPASYTLTADNIKGFATEWDPFPPHVDEAAAASSPVGSLFAAGVHLLSITIRLSHSILSEDTSSIASRGWEKLRFRRPGVVGDELRVRVVHVERRRSHRPERGILVTRFELFNQKGDTLVSFDSEVVMLRRTALDAA
ncbi:MAG: MaoC/PaaZ C-terminal domain-containing protein [Zoogloea sp.]|uniref:MaoC/PaaZ C-terminal domain-containing protein n=1 Tax=Zoogloea sp. TaxID=49181 RepID=UPI002639F3B3|nr:MaoC/PaaZ C-terminal domain-containing protein [Zoogloea sp.]MDD3327633.1 MaoC/PaaZ C-terminal domain-containing protein [Zoogloea sp.]